MKKYLIKHHEDDVLNILKSPSIKEIPFQALKVDLKQLIVDDLQLYKKLNYRINVHGMRLEWVEALNIVQEHLLRTHSNTSLMRFCTKKLNFPVTFVNHPDTDVEFKPFLKLWTLVQIEGSVIRSKDWRRQELVKDYACRKCKHNFKLHAERLANFSFSIPSKCPKTDCKGNVYEKESLDGEICLKNFISYQEITVQPYDIPVMLIVELDEELIETCFVGDAVTICGTYESRSEKAINNNHRLVMRAISVTVHKHQQKMNFDPLEMNVKVQDEWQESLEEADNNEFKVRDIMINSVAPVLDGLAIAKLGLMLILCSGGESSKSDGHAEVRDIAHFLLIGDPGLGKSQLLKAAAAISVNSVKTVGYAVTTAGLTATHYRAKGETHLEAGALVKANNGVCCIDEINLMSKEHRGCIHEVMESQTITINKAGFTGKLNAKCSIIASMNQRNSNLEIDASNIAMEGSLMSRFDLVFEVVDPKCDDFLEKAMNLILNDSNENRCKDKQERWSLDRLQMHILVAKKMKVELTEPTKAILQNYYRFCKNHEEIDRGRRTVRLYNTLERLTICHAKLMLRNKTELMDAVTTVMLMESSWSFGHLLPQSSVVLSRTPLGPSNEFFANVFEKLSLEFLLDMEIKPSPPKKKSQSKPSQTFSLNNIDDIFDDAGDSDNEKKTFETEDDDYIFSSQAINDLMSTQSVGKSSHTETQSLLTFKAEACSEEDIFGDDLTFNPVTQSTSTQATSNLDKRTSFGFNGEEKKRKLEEVKKIVSDPLKDNLNTLAALFSGTDSSVAKLPQPVQRVQENAYNKLKKFRFNDPESENEPSQLNDENIHSTEQNNEMKLNSEVEQIQKPVVAQAIDDFDIWGDFEFDV